MEDIFWIQALWLSAFTLLMLVFSWATRQGFPVLSVPINSAGTQMLFLGASGPLQGPRVWALGCMDVWLTTWYLPELWNDEETAQYTNLAQLNLRPWRDLKYDHKSAAVCHRVFSEWVSQRIGMVPGANFTIPQAPYKISPWLSPPRLVLFNISHIVTHLL